MSESERLEWDRRYAEGEYRARTYPAPFLEEWLPRFRIGRALDVACGAGRNALRLAEAGFQVEAVDISHVAIDLGRAEAERRGLELSWRVADLDELDIGSSFYDLITVIRYVNRPMWPRLLHGLTKDGWLLIEHHLKTNLAVDGPQSSEFRLAPQELLQAFADLRIVHYSEIVETEDSGATVALARLVACKGNPGW